jgi:hypothetical protein
MFSTLRMVIPAAMLAVALPQLASAAPIDGNALKAAAETLTPVEDAQYYGYRPYRRGYGYRPYGYRHGYYPRRYGYRSYGYRYRPYGYGYRPYGYRSYGYGY